MVMGRWDQQAPNLHFAWLESQHLAYARFRVGLFKEPFSMEGLRSDQYWDFVERSLGVANFLQLEDVGAMLYGKFGESRIEYGVGVFNGRGRSTENNPDKEYVGRLVVAPFRGWAGLFDDLYVGVSASALGQEEVLGGGGFQTGAGTRFWRWSSGPDAVVDDDRVRRRRSLPGAAGSSRGPGCLRGRRSSGTGPSCRCTLSAPRREHGEPGKESFDTRSSDSRKTCSGPAWPRGRTRSRATRSGSTTTRTSTWPSRLSYSTCASATRSRWDPAGATTGSF